MSIHRKNPRRDANEPAVIQALEAVVASVVQISVTGCGDLLVGFQGQNYLMEVKTAKGELTPAQVDFRARWRGSYDVVRTPDEALAALAEAVTVYLVTDGETDRYGIFSTREKAQAWINRQKAQRYPFWNVLRIEEVDLDEARDLGQL